MDKLSTIRNCIAVLRDFLAGINGTLQLGLALEALLTIEHLLTTEQALVDKKARNKERRIEQRANEAAEAAKKRLFAKETKRLRAERDAYRKEEAIKLLNTQLRTKK